MSPTSAAVGRRLPEELRRACFVDDIPGLDEQPTGLRIRQGTRHRQNEQFWRLDCPVRHMRRGNGLHYKKRGVRRHHCPRLYPKGAGELSTKKKGAYNIIKIDRDYVPQPDETKQVFGITFKQGRNNFKINRELLTNIVTKNKDLPESAATDLIVSLITLKYTQSNSVCFARDGQAIGVGAGQQSRIHCTRLAGSKADNWYLRQSEAVLNLPFKEDIGRAERDNAIDVYISDTPEDVLQNWQALFTEKPKMLTREDKRAFLDKISGTSLGSDAFFPFGDNIERAKKSGVSYIAQPGGSVRDSQVIETCDRFGMVMAFTGMRLFHHSFSAAFRWVF